MSWETIETDSVSGAIDLLFKVARSGHHLYRGQSNKVWPLKPSIARIPQRGSDGYRFRLQQESILYKRFLNGAPIYLPQGEERSLDHPMKAIAVAQHHGVPTRLLDWTQSPLVALYFACLGPEEADGVVWIIQSNRVEESGTNERPDWCGPGPVYKTGPKTESTCPKTEFTWGRLGELCAESAKPWAHFFWVHTNLRMHVQQGYFLVCGRYDEDYCQILSAVTSNWPESRKRMVIPGTLKRKALQELSHIVNVRPQTLFPDLGGFAQELTDFVVG